MARISQAKQPIRLGSNITAKRAVRIAFRSGIWLAFFALIIGFSLASPYFMTFSNALNVARQVSINAIVAVGMTFVIIAAGIDLSVGSIIALVGSMAAGLLTTGWSFWLVVLFSLGLSMVAGLFNGYFVAYQEIPPFIVTLATQTVFRGLAFIRTGGYAIGIRDEAMLFLGRGHFGSIPIPVFLMLLVILFGAVLLTKTRIGRHILAVGGNEEAARLSGVNVVRIKLFVYVLSGVLAGIAGLLLAGRLGAGTANSGTGLELDAIASVVLGGTDMMGGRGTIAGTILGAFIIGIISNGLTLLNVAPFYQMVIKGFIILSAVWFNVYGHRKGAIS